MLACRKTDQPKERDMAEQHKPGEKVQTSGIYEVVKEGDGGSGFQVTCVEGEHFPPTRSGKGAGYEPVTWGAQLCGESGILFADRLPRESRRDP
jgi:hypothetical protein